MKKFLERFCLVFFGIFLALVLSETALRIIYPESQASVCRPHPRLGWTLIPNLEDFKVFSFMEFRSAIETNSWGLRDDEVDLAGKDTKIVLVLGDSFTFGAAAKSEETFVELLQKGLSSNLNQRIEVINAGVPAYGTAQELLFYRELTTKGLRPDLVLLGFFTNDIDDNACIDDGFRQLRPCYQLAGDTLALTAPPEMSVANSSEFPEPAGGNGPRRSHDLSGLFQRGKQSIRGLRLYKLFYTKSVHMALNHPGLVSFAESLGFPVKLPKKPAILNSWYSDTSSDSWLLTNSLIKCLNDAVEKDGGQLAVAIFPSVIQIFKPVQNLLATNYDTPDVQRFLDDPHKPQRLIAAFCHENGIPVIDVMPAFEKALVHDQRQSSYFFPLDGHWTVKGNRIVADCILEGLLADRSLLDRLEKTQAPSSPR